jgi:hypothetical protein
MWSTNYGQVPVLPTPNQTFRPDQPLAKKFGPLQNLLKKANMTVFYTLFLSAKGTKNPRYQAMKCTSLQIGFFLFIYFFLFFCMNNHLQKSSALFGFFLAYLKKIRPQKFL